MTALFPPNKTDITSVYYIETININEHLNLIIHDSDPYDKVTYELDGDTIACEYVASYKERVEFVKKNVVYVIDKLHEFMNKPTNTLEIYLKEK
ncbi:MAG: hypothetical protein HQL46_13095 [Gammaproteobacteria bacterium]|nr:hypothetical protein [Gammaproteobacteria bacterium]